MPISLLSCLTAVICTSESATTLFGNNFDCDGVDDGGDDSRTDCDGVDDFGTDCDGVDDSRTDCDGVDDGVLASRDGQNFGG